MIVVIHDLARAERNRPGRRATADAKNLVPSITASQPGEGDATVTVSFASSVARELEYVVACYDGFTAGADLTGLSELFMGYADIVLGVDSCR